MAQEETQTVTEEATEAVESDQNGAETAPTADTKEAQKYSQAEVDARVSAALKARAERERKETEERQRNEEQIAAIREGKFEEALKMTQAKLDALEAAQADKDLQLEAQNVLVELGMSHFSTALLPGTKSIDELIKRAQAFKEGLDQGIEQGVNQRLNTGPPRTPANPQKPTDKTPDQMDKDEFMEWKRARKLV